MPHRSHTMPYASIAARPWRQRLLLFAGSIILAGLDPAGRADPPSPAPAPPAPAFHAEAIRDDIRYLASDALEGRGSGTPGGRKAAEFIAERFRAAGLQPLGGHDSYLQPFPFTAGVPAGARDSPTPPPGRRPPQPPPRE